MKTYIIYIYSITSFKLIKTLTFVNADEFCKACIMWEHNKNCYIETEY